MARAMARATRATASRDVAPSAERARARSRTRGRARGREEGIEAVVEMRGTHASRRVRGVARRAMRRADDADDADAFLALDALASSASRDEDEDAKGKKMRAATAASAWAFEDDDDGALDFDDDDVSDGEMSVMSLTAWLTVVERLSTLGAVSSGLASVALREAALGALAGTLPLVGALARRTRERRVRKRRAALALVRRDEMLALRAKASRNVTIREATAQAAPLAAAAVRRDVTPALEALANRLSSVERAQVEAAKTAAATARDSGAVAGMLARGLAAARVDAREGIASVRDEFRSTAQSATGELKKEMTMLWELVENVEKDTAGLREPMESLAGEIRDVVEGVVRDSDATSAATATLSSEQLAELRAAVADSTSAKVREAVEQLLGSINAVTAEDTIVQSLASKLDESQWEAMIGRLDAIDAGVNASDRVVEDDLEDLRVEIRQEISRDIQGIVDSVADLKMALETSQRRDESSSGRGAGGAEAAAAVKQWAEDKLKAAEPSSEVEEQMQWQAAIVSDEAAEEELVWVGEKSTPTRDSPKKKAMNANVSREEAFANMQALLNSKPPPPPSEDGEVSSSATIDPDEEVWDPFVGAADAENVAKYEAELKEKIESSDTPNEIAENSEKGLTALRAGRDVARRAGNDVDMLEEGDELFAESIQFLELAVSGDSSSRAVGNLGNAHLARGRVQAVLAELALREAASARDARVNVGLDGTAEMYLELAEENLVQAGRYFRAAIVSAEAESEEMKVSPDGVASDTSGIKAKALTGWGTALSLRSELVLSSEGATMDAESLAVAAAEKFKAAAAIDRDSPKIYVSWGDALRLSASLGEVNDEEERLQQAKGCYGEALRLSPDYALALEALRDFDL